MGHEEGYKPKTLDLVLRDLAGGCNLIDAEWKRQGEPAAERQMLYVENFRSTRGGDVTLAPGFALTALSENETPVWIQDQPLALIAWERASGAVTPVAVMPTRALSMLTGAGSGEPNVAVECIFSSAAPTVSWDTMYNRLYIATGTNYVAELSDDGAVGLEFEDGFNFPSVLCRHMGRMFYAGFRGNSDHLARSYIRYSDSGNPRTMTDPGTDDVLLVRSQNDDWITSMVSMGDSLLVFKRRSVWVVSGDDFFGTGGLSIQQLISEYGASGPGCTLRTPSGVYFANESGVFLLESPGAPLREVSTTISPMFSRRVKALDVSFPSVAHESLEQAQFCYDPVEHEVFLAVGVHG